MEAEDPTDAGYFMVHKTVYDYLSSSTFASSPAGRLMTVWLAAEMLAAVLLRLAEDVDDDLAGDEDLGDDSIPMAFERMFTRLSRELRMSPAEVLERVRQDRRFAFAAAQSAFRLTENAARLLQEAL
ncbi:MAG: hypothetical protein KatS3mg015_3219 [Fimbriimonadales bacterium]|nr:MAG: hypothetical protein KatS3mg015_3219 [Fimbriimonadales bacterium]